MLLQVTVHAAPSGGKATYKKQLVSKGALQDSTTKKLHNYEVYLDNIKPSDGLIWALPKYQKFSHQVGNETVVRSLKTPKGVITDVRLLKTKEQPEVLALTLPHYRKVGFIHLNKGTAIESVIPAQWFKISPDGTLKTINRVKLYHSFESKTFEEFKTEFERYANDRLDNEKKYLTKESRDNYFNNHWRLFTPEFAKKTWTNQINFYDGVLETPEKEKKYHEAVVSPTERQWLEFFTVYDITFDYKEYKLDLAKGFIPIDNSAKKITQLELDNYLKEGDWLTQYKDFPLWKVLILVKFKF